MLKVPFYLILFQSLPETAILTSLGLVLIGIKPKFIEILKIALITAIVSYLIRSLPLPPGLHILIQLPILIILTAYYCSLQLRFAALSSMLGLIGASLAETALNPVISTITGISLKEALTDQLWRLLFPIPEFIFLTGLIILFARKKIMLFNIDEFKELERVKSYEK